MNVLTTRAIRNHSGFALIAFLLALVSGASFVLLRGLNAAATQSYRDAQTARALAEAKAALIGYAASRLLIPTGCPVPGNDCSRPGDLPCPDKDNDGIGESSCVDNNPVVCPGLTCRLGRLPWKTLGLPDLRDGSGERLWYAVSNNFKDSPRRNCSSSGLPGCLNSDSRGGITLRDSKNNFLHDGRTTNIYNLRGAIALVIAPGAVLRRTESATTFHHQVRNCTVGVDCDSNSRCTASPPTNTPTCRPRNYLDRRVGWENNENFVESGSSTNGFIQGDILDAFQNIIVNDKILPIGYDDIMPLLEQRVARELLMCLEGYAGHNNQRYPWAARVDDGTGTPNYVDFVNTPIGRVPDPPFNATAVTGMSNSWFANCNISDITAATNWWLNWKEQVFYAVADAYKPGPAVPLPSCGTCLTVDPPSINPDRRIAVMVAGTYLAASPPSIPANQVRANPPALDKVDINNYLEGENADLDDIFTSGAPSSGFNDVTCDRGICP